MCILCTTRHPQLTERMVFGNPTAYPPVFDDTQGIHLQTILPADAESVIEHMPARHSLRLLRTPQGDRLSFLEVRVKCDMENCLAK